MLKVTSGSTSHAKVDARHVHEALREALVLERAGLSG
jgi:hypothetical protein